MGKKRKTFKIHPICAALPKMSTEAFVALKADIEKNGLLEPIWVKGDEIIDGRHRYRACRELKRTPDTREYQGEDVEAFVVSENLMRRHLTKASRKWFARRMLALNPELSSRSIAKEVGLGSNTVERLRNKEPTAPMEQMAKAPEHRVGADGKRRRVKVKRERKPLEQNCSSLITAADFDARRVLKLLTDIHPSRLTDAATFIDDLEQQLTRIKTLAQASPQTGKR